MSRQNNQSIYTAETVSALFLDLVLDAEDRAQISLTEVMESYLVFLLCRFNRRSHCLQESVAIQYLTSGNECGNSRLDSLRDAGDSCLLLAGLFPEQARRRMVTISYFVRIGRSCYGQLATSLKKSHSEMYVQLSAGFGMMLDVLQIIRNFREERSGLDPLAAYDLWQATGSAHALTLLGGNGGSIPVHCNQYQLS